MVKDLITNTNIDKDKFFLSFTRHTPAMITMGVEGLNASIKGFGFVPKLEFIKQIINLLTQAIESNEPNSLEILFDCIYSDQAATNIDTKHLISLEMAYKYTFKNVSEKGITNCTLLYYMPPVTSYELRGEVVLHENDVYSNFANAVHDIYHRPKGQRRQEKAYLFQIHEIFDNSVKSFGNKIY
jgi:hypothetical protein